MRTLTNVKYQMVCDVLKPAGSENGDAHGTWVDRRDPDTGDIEHIWVPDDPNTPAAEGYVNVPCLVRGVIDGGIRVAGTTQRFSDVYENVDWARIQFPPEYIITKHDRITNIRDFKTGKVVWAEEEIDGMPPTTFSVMGVTPTQGPFGRIIENTALLQRTEVQ